MNALLYRRARDVSFGICVKLTAIRRVEALQVVHSKFCEVEKKKAHEQLDWLEKELVQIRRLEKSLLTTSTELCKLNFSNAFDPTAPWPPAESRAFPGDTPNTLQGLEKNHQGFHHSCPSPYGVEY